MAILREDYHYNYPLIHWFFALSALALVGTTIWMIWDDYTGQWRTLQMKAKSVQYLTSKEEITQEKDELRSRVERLQNKLEKVKEQISQKQDAPADELLSRFDRYKQKHSKREAQLAGARSILREHESKQQLHIREEGEPDPRIQEKIAAQREEVDQKALEEEKWQKKVNQLRERIEPVLEIRREIDAAQKKLTSLDQELTALNMKKPSTIVRNLPILNFASPTIKTEQIVLTHIKDDYNYTKIRKVDRCQTCHQMIDKPGYESKSDLEPFYEKEGIGEKKLASLRKQLEEKKNNGAGEEAIANISKKIEKIEKERESYFTVFRTHPKLDLFLGATSPHPVQEYGCTVCHKGRGREMNFARAAHTPDDEEEKKHWKKRWDWAKQEHWHKPMTPMKHIEASCHKCHKKQELTPFAEDLNRGEKLVRRKGCYGCHKIDGLNNLPSPGPSLRSVKTKLDRDWMYKWLREPSAFKHSRMPDFYGLSNDSAKSLGLTAEQVSESSANRFPEFNKVEMLAIREYMWENSEKPENWESLPDDLEADPDRGRELFRKRGCKGCHTIGKDFAYANSEENWPRGFGFDLGGVAAKASGRTEKFKRWLYSWMRDPRRYDRQALMPDLNLTRQAALDISAYIMDASKFQEIREPEEFHLHGRDIPDPEEMEDAIDKLIIQQLTVNQSFKDAKIALGLLEGKEVSGRESKRLLDTYPGIRDLRERYRDPFKRELVWLGERMIRSRGCAGCHEINGLEDAGKIGAELTGSNSVGNKPLFMFDFGNLNKHELGEGSRLKKKLKDKGWLMEHNRWSWFRQKLANPRSFNFGMPNINYRAKLKMPKYEMSPEDRKSIVTFLMGQTNRSIPHELKVTPSGEQEVLEQGNRLINKNNCQGCHRIGTQLRDIRLKEPGEELSTREFQKKLLQSEFGQQWQKNKDMWLGGYLLWNPDKEETSFRLELTEKDRKTLDKRGVEIVAEKGAYLTGDVIKSIISKGFNRIPVRAYSEGAIQQLGTLSTAASPPDLKLVGKKIRSDWLFEFLKNPQENRWRRELPVHMPNFHLSDDEALTLSRYFYHRNDEPYPYQSREKLSLSEEERKEAITEVKKCYSQCHANVSENQPTPPLYRVRHRTRRKWIEPQPEGMGWLARPKELEPGTNMNGIISEPDVQRTVMKYLLQLTREEFEEEIKTGE